MPGARRRRKKHPIGGVGGGEGLFEFRSDLVGSRGRCRGRSRRGCAGARRPAPPSPRSSPRGRRRGRRASRHARRRSRRAAGIERTAPARSRRSGCRARCRERSSPCRRRAAPPAAARRARRSPHGRRGSDSSVTSRSADKPSRCIAIARLSATRSAASPEPKPQFSEANCPSLTPPWRVKNACRTPASAASASSLIIGVPDAVDCREPVQPHWRKSASKPAGGGRSGRCQGHGLEQGAHLRRVDQAFDAAARAVAAAPAAPARTALRAAPSMPRAARNCPCGTGPWTCAPRACAPRRESGEIDMRAQIGSSPARSRIDTGRCCRTACRVGPGTSPP